MRASPVILNEGKDLLHLNEEILRCVLLDFQETTRDEFRLKELIGRSTGGSGLRPRIFDLPPQSPNAGGRIAKTPEACPDPSGNWRPGGECQVIPFLN